MASACVNTVGIPSENFLDFSPVNCPSYGWPYSTFPLTREFTDNEVSNAASDRYSTRKNQAGPDNADPGKLKNSDPEISDFEFRLVDPVEMPTADELFCDGKLVPFHLPAIRRSSQIKSTESLRIKELSPVDPCLFSPKAPSCTTRWKEILGLKLYQNGNGNNTKTTSSSSPNNNSKSARSLKHFLNPNGSKRGLNASTDSRSSSLTLPLLKELSDNEAMSTISSLISLSSSGHEYDDVPRLSLNRRTVITHPRNNQHSTSTVRLAKHRSAGSQTASLGGVSVDSPRMNSYGKIVFHGLERSSSSPSTCRVGPRSYKSSMERSYSANVRVTPVLNVPVGSLIGSSKNAVFGLFSTQHKKNIGVTISTNRIQQHHIKNRTDRT